MKQTFDHAEDVLRFYLKHPDSALIVLSSVLGGTIRAKGSMMAVTPSVHAGYISNGCVDADIIARARAGQSGVFVYGEGSPYRDITLPCGGSIEVRIFQDIDAEMLKSALSDLSRRKETFLRIGTAQIMIKPRIHLRIAGRGAVCIALAELALASGFLVQVQSPEVDIFPGAIHLKDVDNPPALKDDSRTAMVCLFHDHDWETALLQQALNGPAFYVGAMGSETTHIERSRKLSQAGMRPDQIKAIKAPIGLVSAQRDSRFLAISILAEIIQTAQSKGLI